MRTIIFVVLISTFLLAFAQDNTVVTETANLGSFGPTVTPPTDTPASTPAGAEQKSEPVQQEQPKAEPVPEQPKTTPPTDPPAPSKADGSAWASNTNNGFTTAPKPKPTQPGKSASAWGAKPSGGSNSPASGWGAKPSGGSNPSASKGPPPKGSFVLDVNGKKIDPNSSYGKRLLAGGRPLISPDTQLATPVTNGGNGCKHPKGSFVLNVKLGTKVDPCSDEGKKLIAGGEQVFMNNAPTVSQGGKTFVLDVNGKKIDPNSSYGKKLLAGGRPLVNSNGTPVSGGTPSPAKSSSGPKFVLDVNGKKIDPNSSYGKRLLAGGRPLVDSNGNFIGNGGGSKPPSPSPSPSKASHPPPSKPPAKPWSIAGSDETFSYGEEAYVGTSGFWAMMFVCAVLLVVGSSFVTYKVTKSQVAKAESV